MGTQMHDAFSRIPVTSFKDPTLFGRIVDGLRGFAKRQHRQAQRGERGWDARLSYKTYRELVANGTMMEEAK